MNNIQNRLQTLETSGLIYLLQLEPEMEYLFKHALVQDAAYSSLLRSDRKSLHALVGATLEVIFADRLDELAATLGNHFAEGGETTKAFYYLKMAGENSAKQYALQEALGHFTRALDIQPDTEVQLMRGLIYSALGEFDNALKDFEDILSAARQNTDRGAEVTALIELGELWSQRDYQRTGEYYRLAQTIASQTNDPFMQANALNRIGNWNLNAEDSIAAIDHHEQALQIFETLGDENGIAETHDLLGMAYVLTSNPVKSSFHYNKAIPLFRKLNRLDLLSSSLTSLQMSGPTFQTDMSVCVHSPRESLQYGRESLEICRTMHWQAGEAYTLFIMEQVSSYLGEYINARQYIQKALEIAQSIQHSQWALTARVGLGDWHNNLLNYQIAAEEFKQAFSIAKELGSIAWQRVSGGMLASAYVELGLFADALALVDELAPFNSPIVSLGQRQVWHARADIYVAQKNSAAALETLDLIAAATPNFSNEGAVVIRHKMTLAKALLLNDQDERAEDEIRGLIPYLEKIEALPMQWRARVLLAEILEKSGRIEESRDERIHAGRIVDSLLENIPAENCAEFIIRAQARGIIRGL